MSTLLIIVVLLLLFGGYYGALYWVWHDEHKARILADTKLKEALERLPPFQIIFDATKEAPDRCA